MSKPIDLTNKYNSNISFNLHFKILSWNFQNMHLLWLYYKPGKLHEDLTAMTKKYSKNKPDIQSSLMLIGNVDDKNALPFLLKTFTIAIVIKPSFSHCWHSTNIDFQTHNFVSIQQPMALMLLLHLCWSSFVPIPGMELEP